MTKHAFLVGVGEYDRPAISPVHFAARDAEAIGGILRERCGFKATVLLNPVAGEFAGSLGDLISIIEDPEDLFCFFFAGHGVVYENDSYLLLRDAYPEDRLGMYQLSALRDKFARLRSKNRLVFLDCCRNDPRAGKGDAANLMGDRLSAALNHLGGRDIGPAAAGAGGESRTLLLKACREGERAYEWAARRHGAFSWFLKEGLEGAAWKDGVLSAHELCEYVRGKVRAWADGQGLHQSPEFRQDAAAGDIVLAGADAAERERGRRDAEDERRRREFEEHARRAAAEEVERLRREMSERERRSAEEAQAAKRQAAEALEKAKQAEQALQEAEAAARAAQRRAEEAARTQREEQAVAAEQTRILRGRGRLSVVLLGCVKGIFGFWVLSSLYFWTLKYAISDRLVQPQAFLVVCLVPGVAAALVRRDWRIARRLMDAGIIVWLDFLMLDNGLYAHTAGDTAYELVFDGLFRAVSLGPDDIFDSAHERVVCHVVGFIASSAYWIWQGWRTKNSVSLPTSSKNSIGMEFVLIPAGKFWMGSGNDDEDARDDEKPRHEVTISRPFYLGKYPVTQAEWQAVMGSDPSSFEGPDHPVNCVSWDDAQEFIAKLNAKEGHERYRLPTEAEWEYACRAGSTSRFCFGDDEGRLEDYAWYDDNSGYETHPVGKKGANAFGLHDMHGNVWEWVQDWYGDYSAGAVEDPLGPSTGESRVLRGGGWNYDARLCRAAIRYRITPDFRSVIIGFRLALSPGH